MHTFHVIYVVFLDGNKYHFVVISTGQQHVHHISLSHHFITLYESPTCFDLEMVIFRVYNDTLQHVVCVT